MGVTLLLGDARASLRTLPDECVQACVTSPPFYGLRAYQGEAQVWGVTDPDCSHEWSADLPGSNRGGSGTPTDKNGRGEGYGRDQARGNICHLCGAWRGELGLEPQPDCLGWATGAACGQCYVCHLVEVFREVRRVLRRDGVLFLNLGDSYSSIPGNGRVGKNSGVNWPGRRGLGDAIRPSNLPEKNLLGIPWRVALALQADGWFLRCDIVWLKRNGMPDSTEDRPTRNHEYIFLLSKSPRYYWDQDAVRQPYAESTLPQHGAAYNGNGQKAYAEAGVENPSDVKRRTIASLEKKGGANLRSVWDIPTQPFSARDLGIEDCDHFAAFPEELARRCILAGTSEQGACGTCGAPLRRVTEKGEVDREHQRACGGDVNGEYHGQGVKDYEGNGVQNPSSVKARILAGMKERLTVAWEPSCSCPPSDPRPCVVLDIFAGTGTTGAVAVRHGRDAILCEVRPEYGRIAEARCQREASLFQPRIFSEPAPAPIHQLELTLE